MLAFLEDVLFSVSITCFPIIFAYTLMHDGQTNEPGNMYRAIYSEVPVTLALVQATDEETKEAYHEMIFSVRLS